MWRSVSRPPGGWGSGLYHFLFVPLTISLAALTAGLQTAWVRTEKEK
ncbi:cytochrome ubiquinol oxidase subunit I, partial [Streptomyces griseus]